MKKNTPSAPSNLKSKISKPQSLRVLIVEDSEDDVLLIIRELKKGGYDPVYERVETATAMKKALKEKQWDIILCDYKLPKFSGPKVIAVLKETNIDIPIIIVSGTIGEETAVECTRLGTHDYIMKDNLSRLCPAIARELEEADSRSKRKQVEEALRQSEEKYRNLVERASDGIGIAQDAILQYVNPRLAEMIGYSVEELIGSPFANFFIPEEVPKVLDRYTRRMAGKDVAPVYETALRHKNGSRVDVEVNAGVITYEGKTADLVLVRNITERKQMEEALRESEENFHRSLDDSSLGIRIVTAQGETLYANQAVLEIYDYESIEELRKTPLKERYTPESYAEFQIRKEKRERGEFGSSEYEISIVRKNGEIRHVQVFRKEVIWNGAKQFQIIYHDITERKQLEESLVKEREELKLIIDSSPIILFYKDKEGRFIRVNRTFAEALNMPEENFAGKTSFDLYSPQMAQGMTNDDQEVFQSRRPKLNIIEQYESASGIRWVQTDKIPIFDKDGIPIGLIGFAQDITERKRAEEALRESEENFRRSLDDSSLGIRIVTAEGETLYANQAVLEIYGYDSIEDLKRTPLKERYTPESYAEFKIRKQKRGRGEFGPSEYEISIVRKNGEICHVQVFRKEVIWNGAKQFQIIYHNITERKQAEEALRQSEYLLRKSQEVARLGSYNLDAIKGTWISSPILDDIFGIDHNYPKDVNGWVKILHPEHREEMLHYLNDYVLTKHNMFEKEYQIIRQNDGQARWVFGLGELTFDKDGHVTNMIGTIQDITEHKHAEDELYKKHEELQTIIESSPIMIYFKDTENRFLRVNKALAEITGLSKEEIEGKSNEDINPRQAAKIWEEDKEIIATGKPKIGIVENIKTRRGLKILQTDKVPYKDKEGNIIGIVGFSVDITEQKKAQEELLRSEEKYRSLVENAQEGVYQSTAEGRHLTINPAFARMLGYESPEEVMATITDIAQQLYVNPQDRKKLLELVEEKGSVTDFETEFYRKDGSRIWVSVNMHAVRDDQGRILYYQGIDQDITEKKKIEAERQENIERLRKSLGATINAMAVTVETRDPYTAGHQRRVADLASAIAVEINLTSERIDGVRMASMIHDIGKISIPSEILTKPTALSSLEFNLIKTHTQSGYNILKDIDFPWPIARIVLEHHERINGSGYPNGLKGEQILLESRILAIADVVEAISSHRPYRPAHGINVALDEITKNKDSLYDPVLVDACLRLFREKNYKMAV